MTDVSARAEATDVTRVLICDDSAVVRGLLRRFLDSEEDIAVVDAAANGKAGVERVAKGGIDVVILDIEMPVMDGLEALPKMLDHDSTLKVIVASTLSTRNAEISLKALSMGAVDYVPKPSSGRIGGASEFRRELVEKVRVHGVTRRARAAMRRAPAGVTKPSGPGGAKPSKALSHSGTIYGDKPIVLRRGSLVSPRVLAIGASTGGPEALLKLFERIGSNFRCPIFVTQHMPATFTKILAERLGQVAGLPAGEGVDGEEVVRGHIYVAPGGRHMIVEEGEGGGGRVRLSDGPPENSCRPAVDPMLRSLAEVYRSRVLTVILTGMGHDGREGARKMVEAGGTVIAQDEPSSVVWGMPGAVATAGLCTAVLDKSAIAPYVLKAFRAA